MAFDVANCIVEIAKDMEKLDAVNKSCKIAATNSFTLTHTY